MCHDVALPVARYVLESRGFVCEYYGVERSHGAFQGSIARTTGRAAVALRTMPDLMGIFLDWLHTLEVKCDDDPEHVLFTMAADSFLSMWGWEMDDRPHGIVIAVDAVGSLNGIRGTHGRNGDFLEILKAWKLKATWLKDLGFPKIASREADKQLIIDLGYMGEFCEWDARLGSKKPYVSFGKNAAVWSRLDVFLETNFPKT